MKKFLCLIIVLLSVCAVSPVYAAKSALIGNARINFYENEERKRLEVVFDLNEPLDLSLGSSNIIYEYFSAGAGGNPEYLNYKKDKSWSGYLNRYDDYPEGEQKYSSGAENGQYQDNIPAGDIFTSVKTNADIDAEAVASVRITVLRENGSGEKITVNIDGTVSANEKIEIPVVDEDADTGIRIETTTAALPPDTVLKAAVLTEGAVFKKAASALSGIPNFIVFEITLESNGAAVLPDGTVRIIFPAPAAYNSGMLAVYRLENGGGLVPYDFTVTEIGGAGYIEIETDHFSVYILAEAIEETGGAESSAESAETTSPAASEPQYSDSVPDSAQPAAGQKTIPYTLITAVLISVSGITAILKKRRT